MTPDLPGSAKGSPTKQRSSGGSRSQRKISLETPESEVIDYIMALIGSGGGGVELPLRDENATSLAEMADTEYGEPWDELITAMAENHDFDSLDDFFSAGLAEEGIEYFGTPTLINTHYLLDVESASERQEKGWEAVVGAEDPSGRYAPEGEVVISEEDAEKYTDDDIYSYGKPDKGMSKYVPQPEMLEILHEDKLDSNLQSDINTLLARDYWAEVQEWAEDNISGLTGPVRLKLSKGKKGNHTTEVDGEELVDEVDRLRYGYFSIESTKDAGLAVLRAHGASKELRDEWDAVDLADKTTDKFREFLDRIEAEG